MQSPAVAETGCDGHGRVGHGTALDAEVGCGQVGAAICSDHGVLAVVVVNLPVVLLFCGNCTVVVHVGDVVRMLVPNLSCVDPGVVFVAVNKDAVMLSVQTRSIIR